MGIQVELVLSALGLVKSGQFDQLGVREGIEGCIQGTESEEKLTCEISDESCEKAGEMKLCSKVSLDLPSLLPSSDIGTLTSCSHPANSVSALLTAPSVRPRLNSFLSLLARRVSPFPSSYTSSSLLSKLTRLSTLPFLQPTKKSTGRNTNSSASNRTGSRCFRTRVGSRRVGRIRLVD